MRNFWLCFVECVGKCRFYEDVLKFDCDKFGDLFMWWGLCVLVVVFVCVGIVVYFLVGGY